MRIERAMNEDKEGAAAGRAWQRTHPAEARVIAETLVGTFAFKKVRRLMVIDRPPVSLGSRYRRSLPPKGAVWNRPRIVKSDDCGDKKPLYADSTLIGPVRPTGFTSHAAKYMQNQAYAPPMKPAADLLAGRRVQGEAGSREGLRSLRSNTRGGHAHSDGVPRHCERYLGRVPSPLLGICLRSAAARG